ncbi:hypothetical protein PN563_16230, partial [Parabacteroides merdae]|nr:hypothetical protein [Parabacteroides merdae]
LVPLATIAGTLVFSALVGLLLTQWSAKQPFSVPRQDGYFPKIHKSFVSCRKTNVSAVETFISIVGTI